MQGSICDCTVDIYVEYMVVECRGLYRLVSVPVVAPLALAWYNYLVRDYDPLTGSVIF